MAIPGQEITFLAEWQYFERMFGLFGGGVNIWLWCFLFYDVC